MRTSAVLPAVAIGLSALSACGAPTPEDRPSAAPVSVLVHTAAAADVETTFEAGGTIRARTIAVLSSRIVAPVVENRARVGERVRAGQPLVVLDGRELQAVHARADAALAATLHGEAAAGAEQQGASAALALASAAHGRIAMLRERNSATPSELDDAVAGLRAAEARLQGASARRLEAERGIESARSALRAAAVARSYSVIAAPFDGTVTSSTADPGTLATPGLPLVTVEDDLHFRLEVSLDASRVTALAPGRRVDVTVHGHSPMVLNGTLSEIGGSLDPASHTVVVKIDLPPAPGLQTGLFGRARLPGSTRRALAVPATAVVRRGQLTLLFIDEAGTARMRVVHAGPTSGSTVEILAGLTDGERIVVNPPGDLRDGDPITPLRGASDGGDARRQP